MRVLLNVILLSLIFSSYSCNNSSSRDNKALDDKRPERYVSPQSDSERISNLIIDADNYSRSIKEFDNKNRIKLTKPEFIEKFGGETKLLKALDDYTVSITDGGDKIETVTISLKDSMIGGEIFLKTDNRIFAFASQKIEQRNVKKENVIVSFDKELLAESRDNGANWKFIEMGAMKNFNAENMFPKSDYELLRKYID